MKAKIAGIVLLVLAVAGIIIFYLLKNPQAGLLPGKVTEVTGFVGSEKANFLDDPEVAAILQRRFGLKVVYRKAGSLEMVDLNQEGMDFLWPSSAMALELYKQRHPGQGVGSENIFNSPLVIYSWDLVAKALETQAIVQSKGTSLWLPDPAGFLNKRLAGSTWAELGLPELYGRLNIISTDPNLSNSGLLFAILSAGALAGGNLESDSLEAVLPQTKQIFASMGYQEHSTGVLFEQYLSQGPGSFPLIIGYENQVVELAASQPELWDQAKDRVRIIYPEPTVWSAHPLIALTDAGKALSAALQDPQIQALAWSRHGFRTGLAGQTSQTKEIQATLGGILAPQINSVMPLPRPQLASRLLEYLK